MTSGPSAAAAVDTGTKHRQKLIWLLTLSMAALAGLIAGLGLLGNSGAAVPGLGWVLLLPVFALAEVVVIHLPTHRNAHGHTLREIPAVLGLTLLPPQQYVTCYIVGAVLALVLAARMRGVKLAFNAAMFALEAALGALVYHAILQGGDTLSPTAWAAVLVAVLITDLLSAVAVTLAISLTEGVFDRGVLDEALRSGSVAAFINTCIALLIATLALVRPSALPLLAVLVAVLVLAYRSYMTLARGHARTQLLYRFVDRTSQSGSLDEVVHAILHEATELMHVERTYLVEVIGEKNVRCHSLWAGTVHTEVVELDDPGPWWWEALDAAVVRYRSSTESHHADGGALDRPDVLKEPRDGLAAALRGAGAAAYVLVVLDRSFTKETFDDEDEHVFGALAAHAGVAVERARTVSDLETLTKELELARDVALAASEAKTMFLTNFGHEVRTPLTTVLAAAELLEDSPLGSAQTGLLSRIRRSGDLLMRLVDDVLEFSRTQVGAAAISDDRFDLRSVVTTVIEAHLASAQDRGLSLEWDCDSRVPDDVVGDEAALSKVLHHLVDNAVKFTQVGGVKIQVHTDEKQGDLLLAVSDTGMGVDDTDREAIFEVFRQLDGSATRRYEGTGLGLAICQQLTELMGGTITVSGAAGVGSTFTVRLPLRAGDPRAGLQRRR